MADLVQQLREQAAARRAQQTGGGDDLVERLRRDAATRTSGGTPDRAAMAHSRQIASAAEEAAPYLDPHLTVDIARRAGAIRDPATRSRYVDAVTALQEQQQRGRSAIGKGLEAAGKAGAEGVEHKSQLTAAIRPDPERAQKLARERRYGTEPAWEQAGEALSSAVRQGARMLVDALDIAASQVRRRNAPGLDDEPSRYVSAQEWHERLRDPNQKRDFFEEVFAGIQKWVPELLVIPPRSTDIWGNPVSDAELARRTKEYREMKQMIGDIAIDIAGDPLTWVGLGAGSGSKNLVGPVSRVVARAGGSADDVKRAVEVAQKAWQLHGGTPAGNRKVLEEIISTVKAVNPEQAEELVRKTFREASDVGRGQLRVAGQEVIPAVTGQEFVGARAVRASPLSEALAPYGKEAAEARAVIRQYHAKGEGEEKRLLEAATKAADEARAKAGQAVPRPGIYPTDPREAARMLLKEAPSDPELIEDLRVLGRTTEGLEHIGNKDFWDEFVYSASRRTNQKGLMDRMQEEFGGTVPDYVEQMVTNSFEDVTKKLIQSSKESKTMAGRAAGRVIDFLGDAMDVYKKLRLMPNPGFHAINVWDDSIKMFMAGANPLKEITAARKLINAAKKDPGKLFRFGDREMTAAEWLKAAQDQGIAIGAHRRLDYIDDARDIAKATKRLLGEQQKRSANPVKAAIRLGEGVAEGWEDASKLGLWIDGVRKGESFASAATRSFKTLLDYGDRDRLLMAMRRIAPFATYAYKAPAAMVRLAAQSPLRARLPGRMIANYSATQQGDEPIPERLQTTSHMIVPQQAQDLYSSMRKAFGGTGVPEGERLWIDPEDPLVSSFQILEPGGARNRLGPLPQMVSQLVSGTDPRTQRKATLSLGAPLELGLPEAVSVGPEEGTQSLPFKYGPQFVVPQPGIDIANYLVSRAIPGAPAQTFGQPQTKLRGLQPEDVLFDKAFSFVTGMYPVRSSPETQAYDLAYAPDLMNLLAARKAYEEWAKEQEKRRAKAKP